MKGGRPVRTVGVDVGYGFVKAVAADTGARVVYPSACLPARASGELARVLGGRGLEHRVSMMRDGQAAAEEWLVGDAALAAGASRTWDTEAKRRAGYEVLLLSALALTAGAAEESETGVCAVLGLPLGTWLRREERRALVHGLTGVGAWVSLGVSPVQRYKVQQVRVLPQGVGAYVAALRAPGGDRLAGRPVGVLDVGYRTTDYLLLLPGSEGVSVPSEERSGSVDVGIGQAVDAVRQEVARMVGLLPPEGLVDRALRGGGVMYLRGEELDLRPSYMTACRELAARVGAAVQRAWGEQLDYLAAVLLSGGGGAALASYLTLPAICLVPSAEEAIWANAVGFSLLARDLVVARS